jgi:hypothetical protein
MNALCAMINSELMGCQFARIFMLCLCQLSYVQTIKILAAPNTILHWLMFVLLEN